VFVFVNIFCYFLDMSEKKTTLNNKLDTSLTDFDQPTDVIIENKIFALVRITRVVLLGGVVQYGSSLLPTIMMIICKVVQRKSSNLLVQYCWSRMQIFKCAAKCFQFHKLYTPS